jgi:hypothetical protein
LWKKYGKKAAFNILDLEDALLFIDYDVPQKKRAINASLMSMLLESGRIKDEKPPVPKENRSYKRFNCELDVEFFYDEWPHKGIIGNISLSGLYLKTNGPFTIGKEIQVALFSPTLDKGCRMNGTIIRRDAEGMGILRTIIHEVQAVSDN